MKKISYDNIDYDKGFCKDAEGWCIDEIGNRHYFVNGYMESIDDQPASVYVNDTFDYRKKGILHRIGKPADISIGRETYYLEGKKHRMDGPAVIDASYGDQYYIDNLRLSKYDFDHLPRDENGKVHSEETVNFIGQYGSKSFMFYHGKYCETTQEFNAMKLDKHLPQKEHERTKLKL